jgi:hypothetical protein
MDTILRGHRGRRLVRLLPVIAIAVALGVIYVMMATSDPQRRGARAASDTPRPAASRPAESGRAADLYYQNQLNYDQAYYSCKELGVDLLASSLGVAARPGPVAAAYAKDELPAFRDALRQGCLQALQNKPPARRSPDDVDRAAP